MTQMTTGSRSMPATLPLPSALAGAATLIIGGSSGIGLATARLLRSVGADVTIAARDADRLRAAAAQIDETVTTVQADVTDPASLDELFSTIGALDHVYVAAGTYVLGTVVDTPADDVRASFDERMWGAYETARRAVPLLRPGGSLTFTSGISVGKQLPGASVGAAANGAVEIFVRTLALEIAPLRANVIRPGRTDTPWFRSLIGAAPDASGDSHLAAAGAHIPVGRVATADEVAATVLFAMANPSINGAILPVDGGESLG